MISRLLLIALLAAASLSQADETPYRINAGDILLVYVWNEKDLSQELLVRPDGVISLPLAGQVIAGGRTPEEVEKNLADNLSKYLKDRPVVTVALKQTAGHKIYVLGKVNRPGEFPVNRPTDIMQALALAGGLNAFAAENSITVLRRDKDGKQTATVFEYGEVKDGDDLETNILLESGDIVVVP